MPHKLECHNYSRQPFQKSRIEPPAFPDDFAIAMGAPVAALVQDKRGREGSVGAHAEELSRRLGVTVVAYQDLGPKVTFPELRQARFRMHPDNFAEYAGEVTELFVKHLTSSGIQRIAFRIHSGNGPLGTQLARNFQNKPEGIAATHLAVSDAVGLKRVPSFRAGLKLWLSYRFGPEKLVPVNQRPDAEQPCNTFRAFASDIAVRGALWRTPITLENLRGIREKMPDTAALIHLPGSTFNGRPEEMEQLAASLPEREAGAAFRAEFCPGDYHSTTYDSFAGNAIFVRRALALAPFQDA